MKYTDDDLKVISYKRLVGINSISVLGIRDDLADRLIHFETQRIPGDRRRTESELQRHFDENAPAILAGLLDLVVQFKQLLPGIQTQGLPRMADFAKIVIALDQLRGTNGFSEYVHDIDAHARDVFTNEPFLILLRNAVTVPFEGDAAIFHNRMIASLKVSDLHIPYEEIPRKPVWVTTKLKQHADTLRRAGWKVTNLGNRNRKRVTIWRLEPPAADEITSSQVLEPSQTDDAAGVTSSSSLTCPIESLLSCGYCGYCGDSCLTPLLSKWGKQREIGLCQGPSVWNTRTTRVPARPQQEW